MIGRHQCHSFLCTHDGNAARAPRKSSLPEQVAGGKVSPTLVVAIQNFLGPFSGGLVDKTPPDVPGPPLNATALSGKHVPWMDRGLTAAYFARDRLRGCGLLARVACCSGGG